MTPSFTLDPRAIQRLVAQAIEEDLGSGDLTAQIIAPSRQATAEIITREAMVLCGIPWAKEVFRQIDSNLQIHWHASDGAELPAQCLLATLKGAARSLVTAERTALNFLQTLSGTATLAHSYATRVKSFKVQLLDTRKTIPGLRHAQKYAVACGGLENHRFGLYDAVLIKENHIAAAGSVAEALQLARNLASAAPIEIEVETLEQLSQALENGATRILLDNFSLEAIRTAVHNAKGRATLEVSGGVNLENLTNLAQTGVDFISIGALTKNVQAIDLSMRLQLL